MCYRCIAAFRTPCINQNIFFSFSWDVVGYIASVCQCRCVCFTSQRARSCCCECVSIRVFRARGYPSIFVSGGNCCFFLSYLSSPEVLTFLPRSLNAARIISVVVFCSWIYRIERIVHERRRTDSRNIRKHFALGVCIFI